MSNSNFIRSKEKQLEDYLHQHIPISASMGIAAEYASTNKVILTAPLSENINHKMTIFGGSLHAVATLTCWSLLYLNLKNLNLKNLNLKNQIVIAKSETIYHHPVDADFKVECMQPNEEDWQRFMKMLIAKKKARINLSAYIYHKERLCVTYHAAFVAILNEAALVNTEPFK